ncbi:ER degradation-enhancing alpha-mannosidase-like protein 1 [Grifola frondosa]|uniref:alpha-1,2-Mannosidase n=1 Tax=Grifola frondosa TaxID=5627 RepID=A0A1C7M492_GRIFR|nr:ER degradation-enhancing alpha-mannosidase-like protein 1 [Grifola frondosa]
MKWLASCPRSLLAVLIIGLEGHNLSYGPAKGLVEASGWTTARKLSTREKARDLWYHGFNNYMKYAFPLDELAPLSCTGRGPDWHNPANYAANDVAGNFSVTLIDALDTFVVLNDPPGFERAVHDIIDWVSFDVNTKPQVFETNIRVLGGLLSGHLFANQTGQPYHLPWYRGELLALARDLGNRLLPAFQTPTGLPYARVLNLRHGVPKGESIETCTAGAGSLIIEFGTLSRLTGDERFEKAAYKAFFALWNRKSDLGLVGNTISTWTGAWLHPEVSGVGAGIDSFYEYALKWYIMSGEVEFLDVWQEAYAAIMRYSRSPDGFWYRNVNIHTGDVSFATFDSLSAFWPGLQVLAGDVENAIKSHLIYWNIWRGFSGLPEIWDMSYRQATSFQYPLRPEFVESTWYLYRATRDPFYLDIGLRILHDITARGKVDCGIAGISDLRTNAREDRMESFVLSETLKYLYLLFDEANPINGDDSNFVFTTEGHILSLDRNRIKPLSSVRRKLRRVEHVQCPAYQPIIIAYDDWDSENGMSGGIRSRPDVDYVRELIGIRPTDIDIQAWSPSGWCAIPKVDLYSYDFVLSADGQTVSEDLHPTTDKIISVADGYVLHNVTGIRAHIVSRLDGKGYDVTKLGPYAVKTGQLVYINDTALTLAPVASMSAPDGRRSRRSPEVELRLYLDYVDPLFHLQQPAAHDMITETIVVASTALFGGDPAPSDPGEKILPFGRGEGTRVVRDHENPYGCVPYSKPFNMDAVVVRRGECTFLEKLVLAQIAGASGVVVLGDEDNHINPSADADELAAVGDAINDKGMD